MNIKIGNTPLIKIKYKYRDKEEKVYAKLEYYNMTGSIKDRVAYYIIKEGYKKGYLKKNQKIVEATSGNTGISLAAIGAYFKNPVYIFMPNWVSKERIQLMKLYGAEVILVSKEEGGFIGAINKAKEYAIKSEGFFANQFENENNIKAHYETTGKEILEKMENEIGGFVSGIGTGGTLVGVAKRLKEQNDQIKIYALEPDKMAILSGKNVIGNHKIEGIGDDFIPKIVDKTIIDKIILVNDDDAINMSRKLSCELGIGVGVSSGANMIASVLAKEENKKEIVTIFVDDSKKYLSTDLVKPVDNCKEFISNKIKLLDYEFIN